MMSTLGAKNEELTVKLLNSLKTYVRYSIILDMTGRKLRLRLGRWWWIDLSFPRNLVIANEKSDSVLIPVEFVTSPVQAYARLQIASTYSHST